VFAIEGAVLDDIPILALNNHNQFAVSIDLHINAINKTLKMSRETDENIIFKSNLSTSSNMIFTS